MLMPPTPTSKTAISAAAGTTVPSPPTVLIPSLPDDVTLNILARVPRSHHHLLAVVSKPFRSLISSPLLYTARKLLQSAQPSLYLCLRAPNRSSLDWFTLHSNSSNPSKPPFFLVPLPPTPSPLVGSAFVSLGQKIYVIGGSVNDVPSPHVWALDCRFHTWEAVPNMSISREFPAAGTVDGKIYVIGGCVVDTWARSRHWVEMFDPKTSKWEAVDSPVDDNLLREKWMHASAVIDGSIYAMADRNGVVYEPRNKKWMSVDSRLDRGWRGRACVVDGVLYCYDYLGKIRGFDSANRVWKELKGVEKELPKFLCGAAMANAGGKLVVIWEVKAIGSRKEMEVWFAEIGVEKKQQNGDGVELWGKIEWRGVVHKSVVGSSIVHCLAVDI